ncbi:TRAM domain-containing protein [Methanobrevibacter curvatus]|jgi:predicted RNA-binding protein with TRAM domain|uniref:23S rRNA (Uracil-C(5))-methyltransferase RlmCD n=1 Tax=Methanobrevibacter curvatus TaxID=49547 RepID=A0A166A2V5_9EURY|nr:TRAM domain-containing protein [Methanobrevibacter curvatus]KZX11492.1 23S rRNA (uracil-C(5))-methyltransferase RlmCD [Methanobrevibacter curvatus]
MFEDSYNRREEYQVPVEVDSEYDVKIEDQGKTGDGIARIDGYVIFVPGTEVGQEVKVKINATRRKFGFGEKVE